MNSLFDISNIALQDELLKEFNLLSIAKKELKNTLIKKTGDVWKTIHPKWDMELLKHMFSLDYSLDDVENSFKEIVKDIINNQKVIRIDKFHILSTIYYTFIKEKVITLDIIERMINLKDVENKLDDNLKAMFYAIVIGLSYSESGRDKEALDFYDKSLKINPNYGGAYNNKGLSLSKLGRYEESIYLYNKVIEINPEDDRVRRKQMLFSFLNLVDMKKPYLRLQRFKDKSK